MKTTGLLGIVAMLVLVDVACGGVVFTNRANVNLLNARDVEITANHQASSPNNLRGKGDNYNANWNSGYIGPGKEVITIDFKRVRNIKTIRTYVPGSYGMPTVTVETSGNGIDWTAQSHATSPATNNSSTYTFTLDAAGGVDARWLRITGETYQSDSWSAGNRYIAYMDLRVYGDSGTLASGASLDLVSSSAWREG